MRLSFCLLPLLLYLQGLLAGISEPNVQQCMSQDPVMLEEAFLQYELTGRSITVPGRQLNLLLDLTGSGNVSVGLFHSGEGWTSAHLTGYGVVSWTLKEDDIYGRFFINRNNGVVFYSPTQHNCLDRNRYYQVEKRYFEHLLFRNIDGFKIIFVTDENSRTMKVPVSTSLLYQDLVSGLKSVRVGVLGSEGQIMNNIENIIGVPSTAMVEEESMTHISEAVQSKSVMLTALPGKVPTLSQDLVDETQQDLAEHGLLRLQCLVLRVEATLHQHIRKTLMKDAYTDDELLHIDEAIAGLLDTTTRRRQGESLEDMLQVYTSISRLAKVKNNLHNLAELDRHVKYVNFVSQMYSHQSHTPPLYSKFKLIKQLIEEHRNWQKYLADVRKWLHEHKSDQDDKGKADTWEQNRKTMCSDADICWKEEFTEPQVDILVRQISVVKTMVSCDDKVLVVAGFTVSWSEVEALLKTTDCDHNTILLIGTNEVKIDQGLSLAGKSFVVVAPRWNVDKEQTLRMSAEGATVTGDFVGYGKHFQGINKLTVESASTKTEPESEPTGGSNRMTDIRNIPSLASLSSENKCTLNDDMIQNLEGKKPMLKPFTLVFNPKELVMLNVERPDLKLWTYNVYCTETSSVQYISRGPLFPTSSSNGDNMSGDRLALLQTVVRGLSSYVSDHPSPRDSEIFKLVEDAIDSTGGRKGSPGVQGSRSNNEETRKLNSTKEVCALIDHAMAVETNLVSKTAHALATKVLTTFSNSPTMTRGINEVLMHLQDVVSASANLVQPLPQESTLFLNYLYAITLKQVHRRPQTPVLLLDFEDYLKRTKKDFQLLKSTIADVDLVHKSEVGDSEFEDYLTKYKNYLWERVRPLMSSTISQVSKDLTSAINDFRHIEEDEEAQEEKIVLGQKIESLTYLKVLMKAFFKEMEMNYPENRLPSNLEGTEAASVATVNRVSYLRLPSSGKYVSRKVIVKPLVRYITIKDTELVEETKSELKTIKIISDVVIKVACTKETKSKLCDDLNEARRKIDDVGSDCFDSPDNPSLELPSKRYKRSAQKNKIRKSYKCDKVKFHRMKIPLSEMDPGFSDVNEMCEPKNFASNARKASDVITEKLVTLKRESFEITNVTSTQKSNVTTTRTIVLDNLIKKQNLSMHFLEETDNKAKLGTLPVYFPGDYEFVQKEIYHCRDSGLTMLDKVKRSLGILENATPGVYNLGLVSSLEDIHKHIDDLKQLILLTRISYNLDPQYLPALREMDSSLGLLASLYDMVADKQLALMFRTYIANTLYNLPVEKLVEDKDLKESFSSVSELLRMIILQDKVNQLLEVLHQRVFPFAYEYSKRLTLPEPWGVNGTDDENTTTAGFEKLIEDITELTDPKRDLQTMEKYYVVQSFNPDECSGDCSPFYFWPLDRNKGSTKLDFLSGDASITLWADILKKHSVKEALRGRNFKIRLVPGGDRGSFFWEEQLEEINALLKDVTCELKHGGSAYTTYQDKIYRTKSLERTFEHSLGKKKRRGPKSGEYMLSPFTEWTVLLKWKRAPKLQELMDLVEGVELVGEGRYVKDLKEDLRMDEYYEPVVML